MIFQSGVFSDFLDNGRASSDFQVESEGIRAELSNGKSFFMPFDGMSLSLGGNSGKIIFCKNNNLSEKTEDKKLCFYTDDPAFFEELKEERISDLEEDISQIDKNLSGRKNKRLILFLVIIFVLFSLFMGVFYVQRNAINWIPYKADEELGNLAYEQMKKTGELNGTEVSNEVITKPFDDILVALKIHAKKPGTKFVLHVIDSDIVNAFALPGGNMVIYTGLIDKAESWEEVAGVLAHEMSHVTLRHGMNRIISSVGIVILVQAVFGDYSGVATVFAELGLSSYSREQETEADLEAVRMLYKAGIEPESLSLFFKRLEKEKTIDTPDVLNWLSSHPDNKTRIKTIADEAAKIKALDSQFKKHNLSIDWKEIKDNLSK